ncbi:hypothetical protein SH584_11425 [Sphingomonas sp. LY29]|uniref:hypothetical protein n=1 Tax=Sphingomonas sp. LY29 TaxID=3095341 RepID=UPI002D781741|nr:hypothetical protein [Sphingomonas sp. LY29]WRP25642.1 hypothetical protein SH584_11425 [Sphingomonas sp. LY29]
MARPSGPYAIAASLTHREKPEDIREQFARWLKSADKKPAPLKHPIKEKIPSDR